MATGPQAARILIVDDDPSNARLLALIFDDNYEVLCATDGEQALEMARQEHPEVILLDVMMPGIDGFEVCSRLKADGSTSGIPVIFITGVGDFGAETRGLKLGAVDYVTKPISPPVVKMRVRNQIELKQARDELTRLSITDGLTGLANRRHFDETLAKEYARLARHEGGLSLILLDVDYFKGFNDTYGHCKGDECLRAVANVISEATLRPADLGARYGGEEFACVLPDTDSDGALAIAEGIRNAIEALRIPHAGSASADHVTASFGIATRRCLPGGSPLELIAEADRQLYRAKMGGRNRVCSEIVREH
jgi:diguanylate cyclase (GGDEF)-like protein